RSVMAGWNQDKAPKVDAIPDQPRIAYRGEVADVYVPLKAQLGGATAGMLIVGFSTAEATREAEDNRQAVLLVSGLVFAIGLIIALLTGTLISRPIMQLRYVT